MKVLVLDATRPHLNPNPEIVHSITEAFRRIGQPHNVTYATQWDFESLAASRQPELILAIAGQICGELAAPLAAVRARQETTVGWWLTDDPYEIDGNLPRARLFDFVATNDLCSAGRYSGTSVLHVPLAADRRRHFREVRRADNDYQWDLVFCGVAFPNRLAWIQVAAPVLARYKTLVLGPGWPSLRFTSSRRISNADLTDLYNSSRIVMNLPRSFNISNQYGFPASTPAPRTFEAAAAGGFQLVSADRPEFHRHFDIPAEMDLFLNVQDLQAKIKRYLDSPGERIEAALHAQRRVLESHLYEHRAAAILDHVQQLRASSPGGTAPPLSRKPFGGRLKTSRTPAKLNFVMLPSGVQVAATRVSSS
ncbi:MAG: glycosyltransferase [Thermoguttaceae bacterium]